MFKSTECRARAEELFVEAERDSKHQRRHRNAAEAWLTLAKQMRQAEIAESMFGGDQMSDPYQFRKEARDCLNLAAGAVAKRDRLFWLWLAQQWLTLAQGVEEAQHVGTQH
jgi:hypothetical protein